MRRVWLVAALASTGLAMTSCSYGFGDLHPFYERHDAGPGVDAPVVAHPRDSLDPAWPCNPVSNLGCSDGSTYCLGDVESDFAITELRCRGGFGSGSFDSYCADLSFCVAGFLCWTDPAVPGASDGTCAEPCFDSSDCTPGYRCETESAYRADFAGGTLFRCVPSDV